MTMCVRGFGRRATRALASALLSACFAASAGAQDATPPATGATPSLANTTTDSSAEQTPAPSAPPSFLKSIEILGLADGYYDWYSTKPGEDAQLRNFDTRHNALRLSLAEIALLKAPTASSRVGFRVDLDYGHTAVMVNGAEPSDLSGLENFQQFYGSYLAPVGKGLQIDVGKFVTQHGAEVIEAKDNWNYSRSLLFSWAIPYYHMGVRASYAATDKVSIAGALVNGWNNVSDNNGPKTFGLQLTLKPTSRVTFVQNYMAGPEQADDDDDWRQLSDTTLTVTATKALSLMVNYDYGHDTLVGLPVSWQGIGGYGKYTVNDRFAVIPRIEWYSDKDGFTTGTAQTLKEFTLTGETTIAPGLLWRIEYRSDLSDAEFFAKEDGTMAGSQHSLAFGFLYSFSAKTR